MQRSGGLQTGQIVHEALSQNSPTQKRIECLPSKCEALSSNPSAASSPVPPKEKTRAQRNLSKAGSERAPLSKQESKRASEMSQAA
jgi:hypothetical protein